MRVQQLPCATATWLYWRLERATNTSDSSPHSSMALGRDCRRRGGHVHLRRFVDIRDHYQFHSVLPGARRLLTSRRDSVMRDRAQDPGKPPGQLTTSQSALVVMAGKRKDWAGTAACSCCFDGFVERSCTSISDIMHKLTDLGHFGAC